MLFENCKYHYRIPNMDLSINERVYCYRTTIGYIFSSNAQLATVAKQAKYASPNFCNIITDDPCWLRARELWMQQAGQRSH